MSLSGPHAARNLVKPTHEQLNSPRMYRVFFFFFFSLSGGFASFCVVFLVSSSVSSFMGIKSAVHSKGNALYARFNFFAIL